MEITQEILNKLSKHDSRHYLRTGHLILTSDYGDRFDNVKEPVTKTVTKQLIDLGILNETGQFEKSVIETEEIEVEESVVEEEIEVIEIVEQPIVEEEKIVEPVVVKKRKK